MNDIILVGGFAETIELCEICNYNIIGIIDKDLSGSLQGYPILGNDNDAKEIYKLYPNIPVIISPDMPVIRKKLFEIYKNIGFSIGSLISPKAYISPSAMLGEGCIVQSFCNISSNVIIGEGTKINTYANVMHDVVISKFTTVAPNALILGYVKVNEGAYIGANSTIIQNNEIGAYSIVGAGAVVTKNIPPNTTAVGVPARPLLKGDLF